MLCGYFNFVATIPRIKPVTFVQLLLTLPFVYSCFSFFAMQRTELAKLHDLRGLAVIISHHEY